MITKKKIAESKKAVFLILGLVHLDIFLVIAGFFPSLPIALFVNSLIIILSLYLTGQSAIDTVQTFNNSKIDSTSNETRTETINENINLNRTEKVEYTEKVIRPRDYAGEDFE